MNAYFSKETGELLAVHDRPELAPQEATVLPLVPGGELAKRIGNEGRRFKIVDGTLMEQSAWEKVDYRAEAEQIALARLDAALKERETQRYVISDTLSISLSDEADASMERLTKSARALVKAGLEDAPLALKDGSLVEITSAEVTKHADAYDLARAEIKTWYAAKRQEIRKADDPLSVEF